MERWPARYASHLTQPLPEGKERNPDSSRRLRRLLLPQYRRGDQSDDQADVKRFEKSNRGDNPLING